MAKKENLEVGQRVKFLRSHDRNVELTGKIVKVYEDSDSVDVLTEPDGRIAEVETTETAHVADVTPLAAVTPIAEAETSETETAEDAETGTDSHRSRRRR